MKLLDIGAYGVPEAARLTRVAPQTARRWALGGAVATPILCPDLEPVNGRFALTFLDLIDLLVVGRLREAGVPLQRLRRVHNRLRMIWREPHPFSNVRLYLDGGGQVLVRRVDLEGDEVLEEVLSGQRAMHPILEPCLRQIEFDRNGGTAMRWRIAEGIVLDPKRAFGKPLVDRTGISTFVLASSFRANDRDAELVADLYGVTPEDVLQAVAFEDEFGGRRAA